MAYTKVKPVHTNLGRCIDYTTNPKKTEYIGADIGKVLGYTQNATKTEYQFYVKAYNCTAENAQQAMMQTKHRYAKEGKNHVLAYHLIQSFQPGEVTPEQAHQIGCEFVERYLADQYEVTISTHLDRKHLHNHVVFNSVSFVDGTMFQNSYADYFSGIRKTSDEVCREYGLSIIDPERKGKAYNEWQAEQQGRPTMRGAIRADADEVLAKSISWQTFVIGMQKLGYEVKFGAKQKYATVKHIKGSRAIRLKSLGEEYTEEAIRQRFAQRGYEPIPQGRETPSRTPQPPTRDVSQYLAVPNGKPRRRTGRYKGTFPPKSRAHGFMVLYYRYLYLLGKTKKHKTTKRTYFLLREDFQRFDRYLAQSKYIWENHIESGAEVQNRKTNAEQKLAELQEQRCQLYNLKRRAYPEISPEEIAEQSQKITAAMKECRKEIGICTWIESDVQHLQEQLAEAQQYEQVEQEKQKQQTLQQKREMRFHEQRR